MTRQGKVGSVLLLGLLWMWLSLGGAISADGIECTWGDAKVASVSQFHPKETSDGRGRSESRSGKKLNRRNRL